MLPLLSLHALATQRGEGLRPELLALLQRQAGLGQGLVARIEPDEIEAPPCAADSTAEHDDTAP